MLFAGLLGANGQKGPAEIPAKRAFTYRFVVWQAKRLGIVLKFPPEHPFNPLPLLRLALACDCRPEAVHTIFRFVWRDGRLPDLPIEWAELTGELGIADRRRSGRTRPSPPTASPSTRTTSTRARSSAWPWPTRTRAGSTRRASGFERARELDPKNGKVLWQLADLSCARASPRRRRPS